MAKEHDFFVIEDCAQAHGSQWRGRNAGTLGDIGSFSFQQRKVMTSGEGGALVTDDRDLLLRLYSLKNCGRKYQETEGEHIQSGNYRITEFQAAILLAQLERFESQLLLMEENACLLDESLSAIEGLSPMAQHPQANRRCYYVYLFRYDEDGFGGLPMAKFRDAFSAELDMTLSGVQGGALNDAPLYQPHTKKRYHWSDEYWQAIDPSQYELPVCEGPKNVIGIFHNYLLGGKGDMADIVRAAEKVRKHVAALL